MLPEDRDRVHQQVAEIAGVQRFQPVLIGAVQLAALAIAEQRASPSGISEGLRPFPSRNRPVVRHRADADEHVRRETLPAGDDRVIAQEDPRVQAHWSQGDGAA